MRAPFISSTIPSSSSKLFTEHDIHDMTSMVENQIPQNDGENSFEANFSEEEIQSKDSNMASFVNFPMARSLVNLDRPSDFSIQHLSPSAGLSRRGGIQNSDGKLKNALNKIYYKKVRTLLGEQLEGEDRVTMLNLDCCDMEEASPKTLYEQEKVKPPIGCNLFYIKTKDPYEQTWIYRDNFPLLEFRLFLLRLRLKIQGFAYKIVTNHFFESLTLTIIFWNTIMLFLDDPTRNDDIGNMFDVPFLVYYSVEMVLKLIAWGLIFGENSYLRSGWNWIDMTIVITGYLPYAISESSYNISVLRAMRVIRPLKTITTLKSLMMILMSLFSAFPYILNTLLILFFFLLIYSITATQLFMGILKKRCIEAQTGLMLPSIWVSDNSYDGIMCGYDQCPDPSSNICAKMLENPNSNITSFDNFLWSLLTMIQEITLENWSYNMYYVTRAFDYYGAVIIFVSLAFIGAFIFLNLMASVISSSYHEQAQKKHDIAQEKNIRLYNEHVVEFLNYKKTFRSRRSLINIQTHLETNKSEFGIKEIKEIQEEKQSKNQMTPQEMELEKLKVKTGRFNKMLKAGFLNNVVSLEEVAPFFEGAGDARVSRKMTNSVNKEARVLQNMDDQKKKDVLMKTINEEFGLGSPPSQLENPLFAANGKEFNTSEEIKNRPTEAQIPSSGSKNWVQFLKKSFTLKDKFKNWKLVFDPEKELSSSSTCDVIFESLKLKKLKEERVFREKLNSCHFELTYKCRQNFKMNKQIIKDKYEKELMRDYLEKNEKEANSLMKRTFFYNSFHQIRLPLRIQSSSFVFKAKMEGILEKNYRRKKNAFRNLIRRPLHSSNRRRKRLQSLIFTIDEIKSSFYEKLDFDQPQSKNFFNERDFRIIREHDYNNRKICEKIPGVDIELTWSGRDVLDYLNLNDMNSIVQVVKKENNILVALSSKSQDKLIWMSGLKGKIVLMTKYIREFSESKLFEIIIMLVVITNTIVLSMNGFLNEPYQVHLLETINFYIVLIFLGEMIFKIIGFSVIGYLRSSANLFDGIIVIISLVDLIETSMNYQLTILRSLRIVRVVRILRPLAYMKVIIRVVYNNFSSFIYICLLLVLFIIIYTLIGFQVYSNQLNPTIPIRQTFDTFYSSFLIVFQLVSIENWNDIETITMNSTVPIPFTVFFLLSSIFFGNYVLLNLFLGVLLDGFSNISTESKEEESKENVPLDLDNLTRFKDLYHEEEEVEPRNKKKLLSLTDCTLLLNTMDEELEKVLEEIQKTKEESKLKKLEEFYCQESLWFFLKTNRFRRACFMIVNLGFFKNFIFCLIFANSAKLAADTYVDRSWSDAFDYCLGSILVIEAFLKIIAFGFVFEPETYLRDPWNILDFCVVIFSVVDMSLTDLNLHYLKIFLLIRSLKLLSINDNMQIVVSALFKSFLPLINLIIFAAIIFLIFALVGINLLQDRMGVCESGIYGVNKDQCLSLGSQWIILHPNFDNVFQAMISIFILSTQENWPYLMYTSMDSNPSSIGPVLNNYKYIGIYFVISLTVLNFFLINLFVGVLCDQFLEAKAKSDPLTSLSLTDSQRQWNEFLDFIPKIKAKKGSKSHKKRNKFLIFLRNLVESKYFEIFLILCILGNIITLASNYDGQPVSYLKTLETINYVFTSVFLVEAVLKILAQGPITYISSLWNLFDFFIVVTSILEIIITRIQGQDKSFQILRVGPQLIKILRVLRVLRVFKLIKRLETLKKLMGTLVSALPSIANVGFLYFMVFYIYAIIGVMLFKDVTEGIQIDDHNNFSNAGSAILLCFKMVTGENWWLFMYDCYNLPPNCVAGSTCGSELAPLFFMSFQVIAGFIVQSLFILVILQTLEKANEESSWIIFKEISKKFKTVWSSYAEPGDDNRIQANDLLQFFKVLPDPLGFKSEKNTMKIGVEIMRMNLESDAKNMVYFHDVLFTTLKRIYFPESDIQNLNQKAISYMGHREFAIREKLSGLHKRYRKDRERGIVVVNRDNSELRKTGKKRTANPIVKLLWMPMLFKTWRRFSQVKKDGIISEDTVEEDYKKVRFPEMKPKLSYLHTMLSNKL